MIINGFLHTIQEIEINVSQVTVSQPLLIYIKQYIRVLYLPAYIKNKSHTITYGTMDLQQKQNTKQGNKTMECYCFLSDLQ